MNDPWNLTLRYDGLVVVEQMRNWTLATCLTLGALMSHANFAQAADKASSQQAVEHYRRSKILYRDGDYQGALVELQKAHALDPDGAELVYNMAVICEKLQLVDEAIGYYERYARMVNDKQEQARVQGIVERLQGAKAQLTKKPTRVVERVPVVKIVKVTEREPEHRFVLDGWVWASGTLALAGLGVGTYYGWSAWEHRNAEPPKTGPGMSYDDLVENREISQREALIADVGFGVALVGIATASILYWGRTEVVRVGVGAAPEGVQGVVSGSF